MNYIKINIKKKNTRFLNVNVIIYKVNNNVSRFKKVIKRR